ncbi:MAG TPA: F0F1 ATP synthase subunit A [Candidatus Eisenbacteria bacterium]
MKRLSSPVGYALAVLAMLALPAGIALTQEHGHGAAATTETHATEAHSADEHATPADAHGTEAHATEAHGADAPATDAHATDAHAAGGHTVEHDPVQEAFHTAENSSFVDLILKQMGYVKPHEGEEDHNSPALKTLAMFQMPIISAVVIFLIMGVLVAGASKREMIPGKHQNLVELIIGGFDEFIQGILGLEGRHFLPFLGTLFLYIWVSNLIGLVPLFKSPTSSFNTTVALAICVFLYVHWTGLRRNGIVGYLYHLAGEPKDPIGWGMVPLMFPLHVIGELAKPLSLSLRLFGNIFGEETLIAVFIGLGIGALSFLPMAPVGIPFQVPFMFLGLLTCTIQALVFTLLSTIYFALMLPHHDHDHDHGHGEGHAAAHH